MSKLYLVTLFAIAATTFTTTLTHIATTTFFAIATTIATATLTTTFTTTLVAIAILHSYFLTVTK